MPKLNDVAAAREFVREHVDLQEVVEGYGYEFRPIADDNVACPCPFHDETEPSFAVSVSKQLYTCYGCHEGGDVFSFIQAFEGMGHIEAIRHLASEAGLSLAPYESEASAEDKRKAKYLKANNGVVTKVQKKARTDAGFIGWLDDRMLDPDVVREYGVGVSRSLPRDDGIGEALGLDRRNQWIGAIVVPIQDSSGQTVAFRNRMFDGPKSMGPRNDHPLKLPAVYGYPQAKKSIREVGFAIVVEGEIDVWQMAGAGYTNTIGGLGTSFGQDGLDWLAERGIREVVLIPDADEAGRTMGVRVSSLYHQEVKVKIATLEDGDPDEAILRSDRVEIQDAIDHAVYGVEYIVRTKSSGRDLHSKTAQIDLLMDLKEDMAKAPKLDQAMAVKILSEMIEIDPTAITDLFRDTPKSEASLHDTKAERGVLTQMIKDPEFTGRVLQDLIASDFHMVRHAQIFATIDRLYRSGREVTVDTIAIMLDRAGYSSAVKVLDSISNLGGSLGAEFMIDQIREQSMRRQMVVIGKGILSDAGNQTISPDLIAQAQMSNIAQVVVGDDRSIPVDTLVDGIITTMHERMEDPNVIIGHDLGPDWKSLNQTIHGLQSGRFMVLAAPSGVGKTSALVGMMSSIGVGSGVPLTMCTLETDPMTITSRLIAHRSEVELEAMVTGFVSKEDVQLIHGAGAQISASPLKIMTRGRTLEELQAVVRHDHLTRGTRVFMLDYVQLMRLANPGNMRRDLELGLCSRGMLELCLELDISIIAAAQINRSGSKAGVKADHTDVGEAFKIAQDTDIFVTVMEKSIEEIEDAGTAKGNLKGLISKNRKDGRVGVMWDMIADLGVQRMREV